MRPALINWTKANSSHTHEHTEQHVPDRTVESDPAVILLTESRTKKYSQHAVVYSVCVCVWSNICLWWVMSSCRCRRRNTRQVWTTLVISDYKPNWTLCDSWRRHTNTQNDRLLWEVWSVWFAQQAAEAGGDTNLQHTLTDDRGIKWMLAVGFRCRMSGTKCLTVKGEAAVCSRWFLLIRTTVTFPSPDLNPNRAVYVL